MGIQLNGCSEHLKQMLKMYEKKNIFYMKVVRLDFLFKIVQKEKINKRSRLVKV